jgi:hypothetical protein
VVVIVDDFADHLLAVSCRSFVSLRFMRVQTSKLGVRNLVNLAGYLTCY